MLRHGAAQLEDVLVHVVTVARSRRHIHNELPDCDEVALKLEITQRCSFEHAEKQRVIGYRRQPFRAQDVMRRELARPRARDARDAGANGRVDVEQGGNDAGILLQRFRREGHGAREVRGCFPRLALFQQHAGELVMRLGIVGIERHQAPVSSRHFLQITVRGAALLAVHGNTLQSLPRMGEGGRRRRPGGSLATGDGRVRPPPGSLCSPTSP